MGRLPGAHAPGYMLPPLTGLMKKRGRALLAEGRDLLGQAGLVARGGVRVDDPLLGRLVDHAQRLRQDLLSPGGVAARDRGAQLLDRRAQGGAVRAVPLPRLDVLTVPLLSRLGIRHSSFVALAGVVGCRLPWLPRKTKSHRSATGFYSIPPCRASTPISRSRCRARLASSLVGYCRT